METVEKQCSRCGVAKPLADFGFRKERGVYKTQCKACCRQAIDAHRYGKAAEQYALKERARGMERKEYFAEWHRNNADELVKRARVKRQQARAQRPPSCRVYFLTCRVTGALFASRGKTAAYSEEGRRLTANSKARELAKAHHTATATERRCQACGQQFTPDYGTQRRVYCSAECSAAAQYKAGLYSKNHRKRARYYNVAYEPFNARRVFTRAKWRCQICGVSTPEEKRGSCDADAPELDHIVPMSKGGPHKMSNAQCACRKCNIAKGARC